jgi:hypothetical protein
VRPSHPCLPSRLVSFHFLNKITVRTAVCNHKIISTITIFINTLCLIPIVVYSDNPLKHSGNYTKTIRCLDIEELLAYNLLTKRIYRGFKDFIAVVTKSSDFWDITPSSQSKINRRFGVTCRFRLHALPATCCMLISCLTYSSTLKMEVICYSETSVDFWRTTQRYIPKRSTLHINRKNSHCVHK